MLAVTTMDTLRTIVPRQAGVDLLALLTMVTALALSQHLAGAVIAFMFASGRALEEYSAGRARRELSALVERTPRVAHRRSVSTEGSADGSTLEEIPAERVRVGDELIVKPHEREHEENLYPALAKMVRGFDPMGAMSHTHRESFRIARRYEQLAKDLTDEAPHELQIQELWRLLLSLIAIVRLHFAQEEELYFTLSDARH